jgi:hypothetical protein
MRRREREVGQGGKKVKKPKILLRIFFWFPKGETSDKGKSLNFF